MLARPKKSIQNPSAGGSNNIFPAGTYLFTMLTPTNDRVRITTYDELNEIGDWKDSVGHGFMTSDTNRYNGEKQTPWFTGDSEQTSIWLGNATPADDDSPDVGERKFFQSFITADGDVGINDLEEESNGEGSAIRQENKKSANNVDLFYNLADALGATYENDNGDCLVSDDFCEMLQGGEFDDRQVIATIENFSVTMGPNKGQEKHRLVEFQAV